MYKVKSRLHDPAWKGFLCLPSSVPLHDHLCFAPSTYHFNWKLGISYAFHPPQVDWKQIPGPYKIHILLWSFFYPILSNTSLDLWLQILNFSCFRGLYQLGGWELSLYFPLFFFPFQAWTHQIPFCKAYAPAFWASMTPNFHIYVPPYSWRGCTPYLCGCWTLCIVSECLRKPLYIGLSHKVIVYEGSTVRD